MILSPVRPTDLGHRGGQGLGLFLAPNHHSGLIAKLYRKPKLWTIKPTLHWHLSSEVDLHFSTSTSTLDIVYWRLFMFID